MILNQSGGGSSGGLNFRVIGGTTEPASPKTNDIWVNTSTEIPAWFFSSEEPGGFTETKVTCSVDQTQVSMGSTGTVSSSMSNNVTAYTKLPTGTRSITADSLGSENVYHAFYDTNKNLIRTVKRVTGVATYEVPTNAVYIKMTVHVSDKLEFTAKVKLGGAAAGTIWFNTATTSNVSFNALKKNNLQIFPTLAKQYINSAWVDVTAKIRQGSEWVELWGGVLYNKGNEYDYITGGWTGYTYGSTNCEVTKHAESIYVKAYGYEPCVSYHNKRIDISKYHTISLNVVNRTDNHGELSFRLILSATNGETMYDNLIAEKSGRTTGELCLDIASLSGEYYIGVYLPGTGGGYEHSVTFDNVKLIG